MAAMLGIRIDLQVYRRCHSRGVDLASLKEMTRAAGGLKVLLDLDELGKIHGDIS
jgi:hypothetical protein